MQALAGGIRGWKDAGFTLYKGVNVPSKTFGELVEHEYDTPRITATELSARVARGDDLVIVDGRPWSEYKKMNIPGGVCCPNGELALRVESIAPNPNTTIVVNCAGRTRSIIGAQTLRFFGVPNPVIALENGTQGWFLAGLKLENGAERRYPDAPASLEALQSRSQRLIEQHRIPMIDSAFANKWLNDATRTTYLFDVRTAEEFHLSTLAGAVNAPGGQLVQATDQWVGVKGARIIVFDSDGVRAPLIAMWLRMLGHDAAVLKEGTAATLAWLPPPRRVDLLLPKIETVNTREGDLVIDLRSSAAYRIAHSPVARWSIRPRLASLNVAGRDCALMPDDILIARAAAIDLAELGAKTISLANQLPPPGEIFDYPPDREHIDHLFFTAGRHEGDEEAAQQYLSWETQLLGQLDADECGSFRI